MKLGTLAVVVVLVLLVIALRGSLDDPPKVRAAPPSRRRRPPAPLFDKSEEAQAKRLTAIQMGMDQRIITKITVPGLHPRAWVLPAFYQLDFETKQNFGNVIYCYYMTGGTGRVLFLDNFTGKKVGQFSYGSGLKMY